MEKSLSRSSSKKNTERTYSSKDVAPKKNVTIKDDFEMNENELDLKEKYDGLTDAEDEKLIKQLSRKENSIKKMNNTDLGSKSEKSYSINSRQVESEFESEDSYSSSESLSDKTSESSDMFSDDNLYNNRQSLEKFDIRELQPMETLSWLKKHGLNKMAFIISKERENKLVEKVRDEAIMNLYNSNTTQFEQGYIKNLFLLSLDNTKNKVEFENILSQPKQENDKKDLQINDIIEPINENKYPFTPDVSDNMARRRYIKPKLVNRLEVTEEGISGENALAFQKYIRDLQEEVKMKDEKLKLREMERDNARLTRDQLTRAVKSSLEIGSGAGKLDNLFKDVIRRNQSYVFRLLRYQARMELKGRLGSEIFAGASLIKHIILKRIKYGFSQLSKNAMLKKDEMFWKKDVVNNEDVATNIISMFKNILSCYKLACIVQHNHISAIKKFLYIWSKCSNLKNEMTNGSSKLGAFSRINGNSTLRELKIAADTKSKLLSKIDKDRLNKAKKGFFSEDNITKIKSDTNILGEDLNNREILNNINNTLSFIPDEKLNHLTMLINKTQEQKNIDKFRNLALSHLANVIKLSCEVKNSKESTCNDTINKITNLNSDYRSKLLSSFENLIFKKEQLDIIKEIKDHANDKFKQPINAPDWIQEKHSKLLEDFYSNPFYPIFVNEYNKRIFMDYKESSEESESSEEYEPEVDEYETESEYDVYYYSKEGPESKPFAVQKQLSSEIHIDPEKLDLEVSKTDNVYICDEADQFETVYYYDENYFRNADFDSDGNQIIYVDQSNNIIQYPYQVENVQGETEIAYEEVTGNLENGVIEEGNEFVNDTEITELQPPNEDCPESVNNDKFEIEDYDDTKEETNEEEITPNSTVVEPEATQL
ncbi:uncharacterized protein cubi_01884 [Cryptosporidium ubiquitum]|uniref:Uncharacterized protein n=1 Tax=Cryptosporidium ubiquitum TaxID=857276 RepID=A0A1J4MPH8_9CRYT|nr:uncharacterized protein cubi_01884 [Cryptosporidium ubiquitum]OII75363.1 hypothetical protein cubi_01884 [Cryptosporidium ubiquitum]